VYDLAEMNIPQELLFFSLQNISVTTEAASLAPVHDTTYRYLGPTFIYDFLKFVGLLEYKPRVLDKPIKSSHNGVADLPVVRNGKSYLAVLSPSTRDYVTPIVDYIRNKAPDFLTHGIQQSIADGAYEWYLIPYVDTLLSLDDMNFADMDDIDFRYIISKSINIVVHSYEFGLHQTNIYITEHNDEEEVIWLPNKLTWMTEYEEENSDYTEL